MKKLFVVGAIAILFGVIAFILSSNKKAPPLPTASQRNSVLPGKTTTEEALQLLGQAQTSSVSGDTTTLFYPTNNQYWNNQVVTHQNIVQFIKEKIFPIQEGSFSRRKQSFFSTPIRLFGPDSNIGIFLYVFLDKGTALLANPTTDTTYEQWYFPPLDIQTFLLLPETTGFSLSQTTGSDSGL